MRKTPLYDWHIANGAKIVDFGGWAMPVQYKGIIEEHQSVRERAGLFDVSHMGEILIKGQQVAALIQHLITNDLTKVSVSQCMYSPMCAPSGGVVDDILVYRLEENEYLLVVNAGNREKDYSWVLKAQDNFPDAMVSDNSDDMAEIAIQGPLAEQILQNISDNDLKNVKYYWAQRDVGIAGVNCLLSRTGYTGEDGFEIYCPAGDAAGLWEAIMAAGRPEGLVPVGLGARDTLRLEAGMPLYGNELNEYVSPLEAGLERFVSLGKGEFIGRDKLDQERRIGSARKRVGFEMADRGIPRHGYKVLKDGREIGLVTSGTFSPTLRRAIGMAYVDPACSPVGTEIGIAVRDHVLPAKVVDIPFYKRSPY